MPNTQLKLEDINTLDDLLLHLPSMELALEAKAWDKLYKTEYANDNNPNYKYAPEENSIFAKKEYQMAAFIFAQSNWMNSDNEENSHELVLPRLRSNLINGDYADFCIALYQACDHPEFNSTLQHLLNLAATRQEEEKLVELASFCPHEFYPIIAEILDAKDLMLTTATRDILEKLLKKNSDVTDNISDNHNQSSSSSSFSAVTALSICGAFATLENKIDEDQYSVRTLESMDKLEKFAAENAIADFEESHYRNYAFLIEEKKFLSRKFNPEKDISAKGQHWIINNNVASIHAEEDALRKLMRSKDVVKERGDEKKMVLISLRVRFGKSKNTIPVICNGGEICNKCKNMLIRSNNRYKGFKLSQVGWIEAQCKKNPNHLR